MLILAVVAVAKPGEQELVRTEFRALEAASRTEPGCLLYVVQQALDDSRNFLVYEQYRDDAALDAHRHSPHFTEHAPKIATACEHQQRTLYRPI